VEKLTSRFSFTALFSYASGVMVFSVFIFFIYYILHLGLVDLDLNFLISSPQNMGRSGGIFSVIVSTFIIVLICLVFVVPVGVLAAIKISEMNEKLKGTRLIKNSLNILAGVPSIVFGLFGALFFGEFLGLGYSLLTGGLTLACMALPLFISTTEQGLRAVPRPLVFSAQSLGLSHFSVLSKVVLPAALPSVIAAVALSIGRALAETAALLFTSGFSYRMPESLLDSGRSLSVHIYELTMNVPGGDASAFKTALVLLIFIGLIHAGTKTVASYIFSGER